MGIAVMGRCDIQALVYRFPLHRGARHDRRLWSCRQGYFENSYHHGNGTECFKLIRQ